MHFNLLLEIHCWLKEKKKKSYTPAISNMSKECRDTGSCKQVLKYWWLETAVAQKDFFFLISKIIIFFISYCSLIWLELIKYKFSNIKIYPWLHNKQY